MKKLFAILAVAAFLTACGGGEAKTEATADTTTVDTAAVKVDTAAVKTDSVKVDSAAVKVDSTKK